MKGMEHPRTNLWMLPISTNTDDIYHTERYQPVAPPAWNHALTAMMWANMLAPPPTITSKRDLVRYYHQCAFGPAKSTWMRAITNGAFETWPGLSADAVRKYLPDSMGSDKGHMKRERKNLRSTRKANSAVYPLPDSAANTLDPFPEQEYITPGTTDVMCAVAHGSPDGNKPFGRNYMDLTGKFLRRSVNGNQ